MALLDCEEAEVRANIQLARAQMADIEQNLADLERDAARLAVARETALTLAAKAAAASEGASPQSDEGENAKQAGADGASVQQSLGPLSDRIVSLVASSGRAWRAREVTEALGEKDPTRDRVHSIRNTMSRLVELGYLQRAGAGLYSSPVNQGVPV